MSTPEERSKQAKRSNAKGKSYERRIARELTKITGYRWRRTPYSGASYIPGDLLIVDGDYHFPFIVELKNRKDLTLQKVFKNPDTLLQYMEENTILIFNSGGQSLVVFPVDEKKDLTSLKICGTIVLRNEKFWLFDLKHFDLIIKKGVEDELEKE